MSIPVLDTTLEYLNNTDLNEPFEFVTDGVPEDFTGDTIRAQLGDTPIPILHTGLGAFQFDLDRAVMWTLKPGLYDFDIIRSTAGGSDTPLLRGKIKLVQGRTPPQ